MRPLVTTRFVRLERRDRRGAGVGGAAGGGAPVRMVSMKDSNALTSAGFSGTSGPSFPGSLPAWSSFVASATMAMPVSSWTDSLRAYTSHPSSAESASLISQPRFSFSRRLLLLPWNTV